WNLVRQLGWAPAGVKESLEHEPQNGLILCQNYHGKFDGNAFFIHFQPTTQKYIFLQYYGSIYNMQPFHGKAIIALNINHQHAPLPLLFLIHKYATCRRNFYQPMPDVEVSNGWQEWIVNEGIVN
ncbi:hypothetical protein V8E52_004597, partial [Russula decolorans]